MLRNHRDGEVFTTFYRLAVCWLSHGPAHCRHGPWRLTRYSEVIPSQLLSQSCGRRENDRSIVKDRLALAFST